MKRDLQRIKDFSQKAGEKILASQSMQALNNGMMDIFPVTIGVVLLSLVGYFPVECWQDLLKNIGLDTMIEQLLLVTEGMYSLYLVCAISYEMGKILKVRGIAVVLLCLSFFMILTPQYQVLTEQNDYSTMLPVSAWGSEGVFVAILIGIFVTKLYAFLIRHNISIHMPQAVPEMVKDCFRPVFAAMVLSSIAFGIKTAFYMTEYGDIMRFASACMAWPVKFSGTKVWSVVVVFTLTNLMWFLGIHPATIINLYYAILMPTLLRNIAAFLKGDTLPYAEIMFMLGITMIGGTGGTLGLNINMLGAESKKYKMLGKLAMIPSIFNINEPLVFGIPIIWNPVYFIPMMTSTLIGGIIVHFFYSLDFLIYYNPTIDLPWVMPSILAEWLYSGPRYALVVAIVIAAQTLLYRPFFKYADKQELEKEKQGLECQE